MYQTEDLSSGVRRLLSLEAYVEIPWNPLTVKEKKNICTWTHYLMTTVQKTIKYISLLFLQELEKLSVNRCSVITFIHNIIFDINLLPSKREGCTGTCWSEVVTVRTERNEVCTQTTECQYFLVQLVQARSVSSSLYGTRDMFVYWFCRLSKTNKNQGLFCKIPTKKEQWERSDFPQDRDLALW